MKFDTLRQEKITINDIVEDRFMQHKPNKNIRIIVNMFEIYLRNTNIVHLNKKLRNKENSEKSECANNRRLVQKYCILLQLIEG